MFLPNYRGLGHRRLCGRLPDHLVRDRTHQARRLPAGGDRESATGAGIRHQRAEDDHPDLRLRRRRWPLSPASWPRRSIRSARRWATTSSSSCSRWSSSAAWGRSSVRSITGFGLGLIEGLTKVFYPEASNTVIFVIMAIVLLIKPAGFSAPRNRPRSWRSTLPPPLTRHDGPGRLPGQSVAGPAAPPPAAHRRENRRQRLT